jgi:sterol 3beta-glucosyltransferase
MHELTAETLTDAVRSCLAHPAYRENATALARRLATEDGPAAVLSHIATSAGQAT